MTSAQPYDADFSSIACCRPFRICRPPYGCPVPALYLRPHARTPNPPARPTHTQQTPMAPRPHQRHERFRHAFVKPTHTYTRARTHTYVKVNQRHCACGKWTFVPCGGRTLREAYWIDNLVTNTSSTASRPQAVARREGVARPVRGNRCAEMLGPTRALEMFSLSAIFGKKLPTSTVLSTGAAILAPAGARAKATRRYHN